MAREPEKIEVEEDIQAKQIKGTCGKVCEVMSRVVGYYRPTRQWHAGKQEEFRQRKTYSEEKAIKRKFPNEKTGDEIDKERLTAFGK